MTLMNQYRTNDETKKVNKWSPCTYYMYNNATNINDTLKPWKNKGKNESKYSNINKIDVIAESHYMRLFTICFGGNRSIQLKPISYVIGSIDNACSGLKDLRKHRVITN